MINFTIFIVCLISAILTGVLGVGGGLIIIPMFLTVLPALGLDTLSIHHIIAISATCVFLNSSVSVFYRRKEEFLPKSQLLKFSIAIIIGTLLGTYYSSFAPKNLLLIIYVGVSVISIFLMNKDIYFDIKNCTYNKFIYPLFTLIGALSASIGIGGAVFFATALKCFVDNNTKKLIPTITFFVFVNAIVTFTGKFYLGYISFYIIPIAFIASLIGTKIGVKICERLSCNTINKLMITLLLLGLIRIISEIFFPYHG